MNDNFEEIDIDIDVEIETNNNHENDKLFEENNFPVIGRFGGDNEVEFFMNKDIDVNQIYIRKKTGMDYDKASKTRTPIYTDIPISSVWAVKARVHIYDVDMADLEAKHLGDVFHCVGLNDYGDYVEFELPRHAFTEANMNYKMFATLAEKHHITLNIHKYKDKLDLYLKASERLARSLFPFQQKKLNHSGWFKENGIISGYTQPGWDNNIKATGWSQVRGSRDIYKETIRNLIKDEFGNINPKVLIILAFSAAGMMRHEFEMDANPLMICVGPANTGKTFLTKIAASFYTNFPNVVIAPGSSKPFVRETIQRINNGMFCLQEVQNGVSTHHNKRKAQAETAEQFMTLLEASAAEGRMTNKEGSWEATKDLIRKNVVIGSANESIVDMVMGDSRFTALSSRIDEMPVTYDDPAFNRNVMSTPKESSTERGIWIDKMDKTLSEHYGHGVRMVYELLCDDNFKLYHHTVNLYAQKRYTYSHKYQRLSKQYAAIEAMFTVLQLAFDLDADVIAAGQDQLQKMFARRSDYIIDGNDDIKELSRGNQLKEVYDKIIAFINANINHAEFIIPKNGSPYYWNANSNAQQENARAHNQFRPVNNLLWMKIEQNSEMLSPGQFDGMVYIKASIDSSSLSMIDRNAKDFNELKDAFNLKVIANFLEDNFKEVRKPFKKDKNLEMEVSKYLEYEMLNRAGRITARKDVSLHGERWYAINLHKMAYDIKRIDLEETLGFTDEELNEPQEETVHGVNSLPSELVIRNLDDDDIEF